LNFGWEGCSVYRPFNKVEILFDPSEVGVWAELGRKGRAQISSRWGFILGEGSYLVASYSDMCESSAEIVIPAGFRSNGLESLYVGGDFAFPHV